MVVRPSFTPNIGSFKGDVKFNILKEKLNDLPPVDSVKVWRIWIMIIG